MNRQQDVTITVDEEEEFELLPAMGEFSSIASQYEHIMFFYESGIQQIVAKLQILNNEFKNNNERNPIENIKSRVKSMESIIDKMQRKGIPLTMNSMAKEIKDIAGVRVICPFISDVYQVANMLVNQQDVDLVTVKDYIKKPKENGYRSLHMIVMVDVYFSDHKDRVPIEIQFRTIAMNFWATVEHSLQYKYKENIPEYIQQKLLDASEAIIEVDHEMSDVRDEIMDAQNSHRKKETLVKDILNNIQNLYKVANQREVTKIQDEFYKVYVLDDMLQLKHFARQLDIISEGYRAQSL